MLAPRTDEVNGKRDPKKFRKDHQINVCRFQAESIARNVSRFDLWLKPVHWGSMRMVVLKTLVYGLSVLLSTQATAKHRRSKPARLVDIAIFPTLTNSAKDEGLAAMLDAALQRATTEASLDAVVGASLGRRVEHPRRALASCARLPRCIAKLGDTIRAREVLYGTANPGAHGGIEVAIFVINSATASIARRTTLHIRRKSEVVPEVVRNFPALFETVAPPDFGPSGVPATTSKTTEVPDLAGLDGLELAPLPMASHDSTYRAGAQSGETIEPATVPKEKTSEQAASAVAEAEPNISHSDASVHEISALSATEPGTVPAVGSNQPVGAWPRYLFYSGAGTAGLGAAMLASGVYYGIRSQLDYNEAKKPSTQQIGSLKLRNRSWDEAERANLLYMLGGSVTIVGGVLLGLDLLASGQASDVSVSVGPDSIQAAVSGAW